MYWVAYYIKKKKTILTYPACYSESRYKTGPVKYRIKAVIFCNTHPALTVGKRNIQRPHKNNSIVPILSYKMAPLLLLVFLFILQRTHWWIPIVQRNISQFQNLQFLQNLSKKQTKMKERIEKIESKFDQIKRIPLGLREIEHHVIVINRLRTVLIWSIELYTEKGRKFDRLKVPLNEK